MTPEFQCRVHEWLKGNDLATEFIVTLYNILHLVDDLTDRDHVTTTRQMQQGFWDALITLPRNAFYVTHFALLNGALQTAILNWHAANRMEVTEAANAKEVAYVLRSSYNDLITLCAWIIGGQDWSMKVAYECRLSASREGFAEYQEKLTHEHRTDHVVGG